MEEYKNNIIVQLARVLIKSKKVLLINFIFILVLSIGYSFFIARKSYRSSLTFLPPQGSASILPFAQKMNFNLFDNSDLSPEQILVIYNSKELRRKIIERFNLYERYKLLKSKNKFELAVKRLNQNMGADVEEIGGMGVSSIYAIKLFAIDGSPDTAFQLISYAYNLLDSTTQAISIGKARKNKEFFQGRIDSTKKLFDSMQTIISDFQRKNKIYDIPTQTRMAVDNYAYIKSRLVSNEIKIDILKSSYGNAYPKIVEMRNENDNLRKKLAEIESNNKPDVMIGLDLSTELAPEYYSLLRNIEVQGKILIILTEEMEKEKIDEAKNISIIHLIDQPYIPEYKYQPKRLFLMAIIIFPYILFIILIIIIKHYYYSTVFPRLYVQEILNELFHKK